MQFSNNNQIQQKQKNSVNLKMNQKTNQHNMNNIGDEDSIDMDVGSDRSRDIEMTTNMKGE